MSGITNYGTRAIPAILQPESLGTGTTSGAGLTVIELATLTPRANAVLLTASGAPLLVMPLPNDANPATAGNAIATMNGTGVLEPDGTYRLPVAAVPVYMRFMGMVVELRDTNLSGSVNMFGKIVKIDPTNLMVYIRSCGTVADPGASGDVIAPAIPRETGRKGIFIPANDSRWMNLPAWATHIGYCRVGGTDGTLDVLGTDT